MTFVRIAAPLVAAYLMGGVPWSLIVSKRFYRVDLRQHGSGNLGATNVYRVLGARAAAVVAVLDVGKGAVAVLLADALIPATFSPYARDWVLIAASGAAMLGHTYSPYIRLRGGKGVATAAGALLVVTPHAWPLLLGIFVLLIVLTRIVSVASILAALSFPALCLVLYPDRTPVIVFSFAAAALVLWRHRSNMRRIVRHEEARVSFKRTGHPAAEEGSESS